MVLLMSIRSSVWRWMLLRALGLQIDHELARMKLNWFQDSILHFKVPLTVASQVRSGCSLHCLASIHSCWPVPMKLLLRWRTWDVFQNIWIFLLCCYDISMLFLERMLVFLGLKPGGSSFFSIRWSMDFLRHFFGKNYSLKNKGMFFRITNDAWKTSLSSKEMVSFSKGHSWFFWGFGVLPVVFVSLGSIGIFCSNILLTRPMIKLLWL